MINCFLFSLICGENGCEEEASNAQTHAAVSCCVQTKRLDAEEVMLHPDTCDPQLQLSFLQGFSELADVYDDSPNPTGMPTNSL